MGKADQFTREDVLTIIENYKKNGRDTTDLENFLSDAFPGTAKDETASVDQMVKELRKKSPVTQGKCSLCGAEGTLTSGVCGACFLPWAVGVAEARIERMRRDKQGGKL